MNKVIRLTSTSTDNNGNNIIVRVLVDSIGQYWEQPTVSELQEKVTVVRFKDGKSFPYKETPEDIDKMLGIEEPKM